MPKIKKITLEVLEDELHYITLRDCTATAEEAQKLKLLVKNWDRVPDVRGLDSKVLKEIKREVNFDMATFHNVDGHCVYPDLNEGDKKALIEAHKDPHACATTHCLAGWACVLAGEEGKKLELKYGPALAGSAIFLRSTGSIPDFYGGNHSAEAEISRRAEKARKKKDRHV